MAANLAKGNLISNQQESLNKLQTSYVDPTLIHWSSQNGEVSVAEFMVELVVAKKLGTTPQIGIPNFMVNLMQRILNVNYFCRSGVNCNDRSHTII